MNKLAYVLLLALALGLTACAGDDDDGGGGGSSGGGGPQEMAVSRSATAVADSGTDALGSVAFGVNIDLTYTINNTGGQALALTGTPLVAISGASNCTATVTAMPTTPVAASGSTTFTVQLNVASAAAFSFGVSIDNDDADENPYDFTVSGTGATVPEIELRRGSTVIPSGTTDALGTGFNVGANTAVTWTIHNLGTATLNLTGTPLVATNNTSNCTLIVTQPAAPTVAGPGSITFQIAFTVGVAGAFSFDVEIDNDDSNEDPYLFSVSGTAIAAANPEIEVFTEFADTPSGSAVFWRSVAPDSQWAVLIMIRNIGAGALSITGAVTIQAQTNCTVTVREQPPSSVAVDHTAVFSVLFTAPASGASSFTVRIPNNDANEGTYDVVIQTTTVVLGSVLMTTSTTNGSELIASTVPAGTRTTLSNAMTIGASGVSQFWNLETRALYIANLDAAQPTNLFFRNSLAAGGTNTNVSNGLTGTAGFVSAVNFAQVDDFVFTASAGGGAPSRLYFVNVNGTALTLPPVDLSGTPATGAPSGVQTVHMSPRRDTVAFVGDFDTAGTNEIYVVPASGGARTKVSGTLTAGRRILFGSVQWLADQSGLVFITEEIATGQRRQLWLADLSGPSTTQLNGTVAAGNNGVNPTSVRVSRSGARVFFKSVEADVGNSISEVYVVHIAGGTPGAAVGLNGGTVPGTGVGEYSINAAGDGVLFTSDSGTSSLVELYHSTISGSTPTTNRIITVTTGGGVQLAAQAFSTETLAWYLHADVNASRFELFSANLAASPTLTRMLSNATHSGGTGPTTSSVYPHPDGTTVIFLSDQGNATFGSAMFRAVLTGAALNGVRMSAASTVAGSVNIHGQRIYFTRDPGAAPQRVYVTALTAGQGAEVVISGSELSTAGGGNGVTGLFPFSGDRAFYRIFTLFAPGVDEYWTANASGTIVQNRLSNPAEQPGSEIKSGVETRP